MTTERIRTLRKSLDGAVVPPGLDVFTDATEFEKREFLKLAKEASERSAEAMRLYRPLPFQEEFHKCTAVECCLIKGNRTGAAQPLWGSVLTPSGWTTMGALRVGDMVVAGDGTATKVTAIYEQGILPIFKITFKDRTTAVCSGDHLWKCKLKKTERFPSHPHYRADKWGVYTLDEIRRHGGDEPAARDRAMLPLVCCEMKHKELPIDPYVLGVLLGDGCIRYRAEFTSQDDEIADLVAERVPGCRVTKSNKKDNTASNYAIVSLQHYTYGVTNPTMDQLKALGLFGLIGQEKFVPNEYLTASVQQRLDLLRGLMDTDGTADKRGGHAWFYNSSPRLCEAVAELVRSLGGIASVTWKDGDPVKKHKKRGNPGKNNPRFSLDHRRMNIGIVHVDMRDLCPFNLPRKRKHWANRKHLAPDHGKYIYKIEPCGNDYCRCIAVDHPDRTYVMDNYTVTHNSLAGFMEDARAATNRDPYKKYPEKDGTVACLGFGEKHIARVIHKYLFRAGAFKIIRDLETREWRVFRPWDEQHGGDNHRVAEAKLAPPIIPPRLIEEIVWEKAGQRVFNVARLKSGWQIIAMNSAGDPSQAQGFDVDLYHIDEDTARPGWYEEAIARIGVVRGKIRWTAMPHAKNDDILGMMQRAEEEASKPNPQTVCIRASIFDNPYLPQEAKEAMMRSWADQGEDIVRKRAYGELVLDSVLMYPTFSKHVHCVENDTEAAHAVQKILMARDGNPPPDWSLDMIVDPGHNVCAVAFMATPPPKYGVFHILYDELYIHKATAEIFGEQVEKKTRNRVFQRFIIDAHGGGITSIGSGIAPQRLYEQQLAKRNIRCEATGPYFIPGADDVKGREERLREWLRIRNNPPLPTLLIHVKKCPNVVREFSRFRKKTSVVGGIQVVLDEADRRKAPNHMIDALEYAAAHGLEYVPPKKRSRHSTVVQRILAGRERRSQRRTAAAIGAGGAHITLGPRGA